MTDFQGRVALVTGAIGGIGSAIARALGHAGASVAVHHHRNAESASGVVAELMQAGGSALQVQADLTSADEAMR